MMSHEMRCCFGARRVRATPRILTSQRRRRPPQRRRRRHRASARASCLGHAPRIGRPVSLRIRMRHGSARGKPAVGFSFSAQCSINSPNAATRRGQCSEARECLGLAVRRGRRRAPGAGGPTVRPPRQRGRAPRHARALADGLRSRSLSGDLAATLGHFLQGFAIAIVGGVALGVLLGSSRTLRSALTVVIEFLRPIPAIALIPIAMLLFGLGTPMIRFVIAYAAVWPILINTLYGVRAVDRTLLDVARTSDVSRIGTVVRVTLPAALPSIATGITRGRIDRPRRLHHGRVRRGHGRGRRLHAQPAGGVRAVGDVCGRGRRAVFSATRSTSPSAWRSDGSCSGPVRSAS